MKFTSRFLSILFGLLALSACKDPAPSAPSSAPAPALTMAQVASLEPLLDHYEQIRASLAKDELANLGPQAKALSTATTSISAAAPPALRADLGRIGAKAQVVEKAASESLAAARLAFGELSRELIGLLGRSTELRGDRRVFECGMAEGYQKWIQRGDELENPYMGQAMLGCGSKTSWEP